MFIAKRPIRRELGILRGSRFAIVGIENPYVAVRNYKMAFGGRLNSYYV